VAATLRIARHLLGSRVFPVTAVAAVVVATILRTAKPRLVRSATVAIAMRAVAAGKTARTLLRRRVNFVSVAIVPTTITPLMPQTMNDASRSVMHVQSPDRAPANGVRLLGIAVVVTKMRRSFIFEAPLDRSRASTIP